MKFRTEVSILPSDYKISHKDKIMMLGSCFAENISSKLIPAGFNVESNPFGILYNPLSVANSIRSLLTRKSFEESDLFEHQGLYHSFSHHSRFSGLDKVEVLKHINRRTIESSDFLLETNYLIITFGSASVYSLVSSNEVVANCHKLPARMFNHNRLSVQEITDSWRELIKTLQERNKDLRILFTVSPIRHWKDGAHESQLNKASLLLAINELISEFSCCDYFPSYEIMLDELRDYRFYAEDMIHLSSLAVDYIWQKFGDTYLSKQTRSLIKEWESIRQALNHKPFNPNSEEYKAFYLKTLEKQKLFLSEHPEFRSES